MWLKFKWDMFVTSFIPLWLSILIFDIWDIFQDFIVAFFIKGSYSKKVITILTGILTDNFLQISSIVLITVIVVPSIVGINSFLLEREKSTQNSQGIIIKAKKANKLSSEFLLAYILPLIAFDFSELKSLVLFFTYFSILAYLCIRNNNIYTNILLEFKKYRMYICDVECTFPGNKQFIYYDSLVISQEDLTTMEKKQFNYWDCDNYIYIRIKEDIERE